MWFLVRLRFIMFVFNFNIYVQHEPGFPDKSKRCKLIFLVPFPKLQYYFTNAYPLIYLRQTF